MAAIELNREDFIEQITTNAEKFKEQHNTKEIAQYMLDNAFSKKSIGTLTNMGKDKLFALAIKGDGDNSTPKQPSNGSEDLASKIIETIDNAKKEVHGGTGLNKFIKDLAKNSLHTQLQKVQPSNMEKIGILGHGFVLVAVLLDVAFKDLKEAPKKFMNFVSPKKKVLNENINSK